MMFRKNITPDISKKSVHDLSNITPKGTLVHLSVNDVKPSPNNPRRLFDPEPLKELKESIRTHGVLVPITAYKLPGQEKYGIVDGERRYRCCQDLQKEGVKIEIPANIVNAPDKMSSLIYMFNIHSFRENWELMPTALSLQEIIDELNIRDSAELHQITGLSLSQIGKCKKILSFPKHFQNMSLDPDPSERIPSNFWVELHPVLEKAPVVIPEVHAEYGRDGITQNLVEKYKAKKIKSVIHFRRIIEAIDVAETDHEKEAVANVLARYVMDTDLETRKAFDNFIEDTRKVQRAVRTCDQFMRDIARSKVDYAIDGKKEIIEKLLEVIKFSQSLLDILMGDEEFDEAGQ